VLPNGMVLITLENPQSQTVALDGYVTGGSLEDPTDRQGVASAVAALLDAGTRKRTKLQLADDLETVSAGIGYSAGTTATNLSGHCLAKDTPTMLTALAETLMLPSFPQEELDKLKTRWSASIRQAEDQPGTRAGRAMSQLIYPPGHPFYIDEAAKQLADVAALRREDLVAFHQRYHGPNHTVLVLVGKLSSAEVAAKLQTLFAGWPAAPGATPLHVPDVPLAPARRVVVPMPDKTNVEVRVGHASPLTRTSPDYLPASLANYVLGGSTLTGRLGLKLRDELGLTYGVSSGFLAGLGGGNWRAGVTVNPANVEAARTAMAGELTRFLKDGVTARELEFARSAFIGSQAVGLATNAGMAGSLSGIELYGLGLDYWTRYPRLVRGVSVEAANAAARKLIHPDKLHTVIVGPVQP
jgi:zinc protease